MIPLQRRSLNVVFSCVCMTFGLVDDLSSLVHRHARRTSYSRYATKWHGMDSTACWTWLSQMSRTRTSDLKVFVSLSMAFCPVSSLVLQQSQCVTRTHPAGAEACNVTE